MDPNVPVLRTLMTLSLTLAMSATGCHRSSPTQSQLAVPAPASPAAPALPSGPAPILPGHVVGQVSIDGEKHWIDGLLAPDGTLRLDVENAKTTILDIAGPVQLVGALVMTDSLAGRAIGAGIVVGQDCGAAEPSRFCGEIAAWELSLNTTGPFVDSGAEGPLTVHSPSGDEVWMLDTGYWGGTAAFDEGFSSALLPSAGVFSERHADFAHDGEVILNLDAGGRFFFQSAQTGCTGNGTLQPYDVTARRNLFRVALTIASCTAQFEHLNAVFDGLSTFEGSDPWDAPDQLFKMWLSTGAGASAPAALTIRASSLD
jgi:hypothetical protein